MWFLLQALIFFAVMASNIAWDWAPNPYVAALIGVGLAIGATQIVTGIRFLPRFFVGTAAHDSETAAGALSARRQAGILVPNTLPR
jgi:hypothetical protein